MTATRPMGRGVGARLFEGVDRMRAVFAHSDDESRGQMVRRAPEDWLFEVVSAAPSEVQP